MFDNQGPVHAANVQQEFVEDFGSQIDPELKEKLRAANREVSPVDKTRAGLEILYVIAVEKPASTAEAQDAALHALGVVATARGVGQYDGPEKRDRCFAIASWAAAELNPPPVGVVMPDPPAVDPAYTTVAPPVDVPVPTPESVV